MTSPSTNDIELESRTAQPLQNDHVVRMSNVDPTQIIVRNLSYTIDDKEILKNINCVFQPGRLSVLVGPSGSGKTTLLSLISGLPTQSAGKNVQLDGEILFNNEKLSAQKIRKITGFVFQDDVILETMTVKEAIDLSVKLRVNPNRNNGNALLQRMMDLTQLNKAHDVVIGSPSGKKGISGGERKRTAIGMELVSNPSILLLDEPTSGLDTYTAFRIVALLKRLAHKYGRTVVATLHQPSSEIFHMIDDLFVLHEGSLVYGGDCKNLVPYFEEAGYHFDQYSNPNDVLFMSILNRSADDEFGEEANLTRNYDDNSVPLDQLSTYYRDSDLFKTSFVEVSAVDGGINQSMQRFRANLRTSFPLLLKRDVKNVFRNDLVVKTKLFQTIFLAVFIALIFLNTPNTRPPEKYQNIIGVIFFLITNAFFSTFQNILPVFSGEKASFAREVSQGYYRVSSYFFAKILVELPLAIVFPIITAAIVYPVTGLRPGFIHWLYFVFILQGVALTGFGLGLFAACLFNNEKVALALSILFLLPAMILGGLFINVATVPVYLRWLQWISPIRYGVSALMLNQFEGWDSPGAQQYYNTMNANDGFGYWVNLIFLMILFMASLLGAYIALVRVTRKAQGSSFLKNPFGREKNMR